MFHYDNANPTIKFYLKSDYLEKKIIRQTNVNVCQFT